MSDSPTALSAGAGEPVQPKIARYRHRGGYHAIRLFDPVTVSGFDGDEEAQPGDWLVVDSHGAIKTVPAAVFAEHFTEVPGKRHQYCYNRTVLAHMVDARTYSIQDDTGQQYTMPADEFTRMFMLDGDTRIAASPRNGATFERPSEVDTSQQQYVLTEDSALACVKKTIYHCFQVTSQRNRELAIATPDGLVHKAGVGDWLVHVFGQLYTVPAAQFQEIFTAVPGRKHAYREKQKYLARQINKPFLVKANGHDFYGAPGDFLVQGEYGQQLVCSVTDFSEQFELMSDEEISAADAAMIGFLGGGVFTAKKNTGSIDITALSNVRLSIHASSTDSGSLAPLRPSRVLWEGWVAKKGKMGMASRWKRRWFRLEVKTGNKYVLSYADAPDGDVLGDIPLFCGKPAFAEVGKEKVLQIETEGRIYYLQNDEAPEIRQLYNLLKDSCFDQSVITMNDACRTNNSALVDKVLKFLEQEGRLDSLNDLDENGQHPIHVAARFNSKECLQLLLRANRSVVNLKDGHGDTPLHIAIMNGSLGHDCVCVLLENGAGPNILNDDGVAPLHLAFQSDRATVEVLIRFRADVNIEDTHGNTPLIAMARHGNAQNLAALISGGAIVDHHSWKDNSTALFWAVADAHDTCVQMLLLHGADCNARDFDMNTPLLVCVKNYVEGSYMRSSATAGDSQEYHTKYFRVISQLLEAGAQVDSVNREGKTALLELCRIQAEMKGDTFLAERAVRALLSAGANVNARTPKGYQPLHYAAVNANYVLAEILVAAGADINSKGPDSYTPLGYVQNKLAKNPHSAMARNFQLTIDALLAKGARKMTQHDVTEEADTDDLMFTVNEAGVQQIKGASLDRLIERLTYERGHNVDDSQVFALHYDKFLAAPVLMSRLLERFRQADDLSDFEGAKAIRCNVLVFLDIWLAVQDRDFLHDSETLAVFSELVTAIFRDGTIDRLRQYDTLRLTMVAGAIKDFLPEAVWRDYLPVLNGLALSNEEYTIMNQAANHKSQVYEEVDRLMNVAVRDTVSRKAAKILGPSARASDALLTNYEPIAVAQQMTLVIHCLLSKLEIRELQSLKFKDRDATPNFHWLKTVTSRMSFVMISEILRHQDVAQRAQVIELLIKVADCCFNMGNFDTMLTICSVLNHTAIHRLKLTWARVNKKMPGRWEALQEKVGVGGRNLDRLQNDLQPPCVPCVASILKHLINIHEEPTYLPETELVNMNKLRKNAKVLQMVQQARQTPYLIPVDSALVLLLLSNPLYPTEDACYDRSTELEAKKAS